MAQKKEVKRATKQIDASLNEPINKDAPPTIYGTNVKPELANAVLNLSVDFLKQQQALANGFVMWHPKTWISVLLAATLYLVSHATWPRNTRTVSGFVMQFVLMNQTVLLTFLIVVVLSTSMIFTLLSKFTEKMFQEKIDRVVQSDGDVVFDFGLTKLANGTLKDKSKLQNSQVIVYRETPIALVNIMENKAMSTKYSLVMGISTIGCRRVYIKSGIIEDLLDWALIRTKNIQNDSRQYQSDKPMKLLVDVYSFDKNLRETLAKKGFSLVKSYKLPESRLLGQIFGVRKELWGVQFHYDAKKQK
ncbi:LADA_0E05798g1_1 [Lachancea dasiensis]|uniref:LADA_0E05798g1_1 n=1 Tax=Lachancea dasiensis TaxID=1072105 RepID=A0A1G4JC85_9SACH|nr:LADA_0E05798g1_1 [Lachancea dasiensis]